MSRNAKRLSPYSPSVTAQRSAFSFRQRKIASAIRSGVRSTASASASGVSSAPNSLSISSSMASRSA